MQSLISYRTQPKVDPQPEVDLEGNETGEVATVDPSGPLRALAFKIMDDRYGALTFTRIYSGTLNKGDTVLNTYTGKTERIGRIVEMHADSREELDVAQGGRHCRAVGYEEHSNRSHPVRPEQASHPRTHGLPRSRDLCGHLTSRQSRC
jgi:elongation factor G